MIPVVRARALFLQNHLGKYGMGYQTHATDSPVRINSNLPPFCNQIISRLTSRYCRPLELSRMWRGIEPAECVLVVPALSRVLALFDIGIVHLTVRLNDDWDFIQSRAGVLLLYDNGSCYWAQDGRRRGRCI